MVHDIAFKRTWHAKKTECESTLNCQTRTLSKNLFVWQCCGRKIAMDKHQCTRTLLHKNDPFGNIIENFAYLFNLFADTKTSKIGITEERGRHNIFEGSSLFSLAKLINVACKIAHHVNIKINEEIGLFTVCFENT